MWRHYRPELVFATEFSDSQDTAGRSEAQVHGIIAAAWPKSLPLFHEFWNKDNHREANSTQAFQSHLKICLVDTPSKNRFWVVLVTVSVFTYTVAIAGMYGSEGWGALLARFDKAKAWLSRPKKSAGKDASP